MFRISKSSLLLAALILVMPMLFFVGCEEDAADSDPTTVSFSDLSQEEQEMFAEDVADMGLQSVASAKETAQSIASGEFYGFGPYGSFFKQAQRITSSELLGKGSIEIATPPDTNWVGPDSEGWYSYTTTDTMYGGGSYSLTYRVRWTPDIWDIANEGQDVTSFEAEYEYATTNSDYGDFTMTMSISQSINAARTHTSGSMTYEMNFDDFEQITGGTSYTATWTDVAIAPEDYSGDFTTNMTVDFTGYDEETMQVVQQAIAFSSDFSFESNGSGTGSSSVGGEEVIRFVFDAVTNSMSRTGIYQLATEDFAIDHDFTVYTY